MVAPKSDFTCSALWASLSIGVRLQQLPQLLKSDLSDTEIQKNAVHMLVVPIEANISHLMFTSTLYPMTIIFRRLIVVPRGSVLVTGAIKDHRYINRTSNTGRFPQKSTAKCLGSRRNWLAEKPGIYPVAAGGGARLGWGREWGESFLFAHNKTSRTSL